MVLENVLYIRRGQRRLPGAVRLEQRITLQKSLGVKDIIADKGICMQKLWQEEAWIV